MESPFEKEVEELSAKLHEIYQIESRRQAGEDLDKVRWPDEYNALPENTKEYDRVLARYILKNYTKKPRCTCCVCMGRKHSFDVDGVCELCGKGA